MPESDESGAFRSNNGWCHPLCDAWLYKVTGKLVSKLRQDSFDCNSLAK